DGIPDLFIGARAVPYEYGKVPPSYFLVNDGKGRFIDQTATRAPENGLLGFVKNANWYDMDGDGDVDLLLALEWGPLTMLENKMGKFSIKILHPAKGWWN
ncbi:VCBS repeat-containing protein, partial [Flavihumibacter sediminis]|nr:VCBS repeat-containing protein [Flavihumibacter sediminis]